MGLAERRRIKELTDLKLPEYTRLFHEQTGLALPIELDTRGLEAMSDADAQNETLDWLLGLTNGGEFWKEPITAWRDLVADDLGRATVTQLVRAWRLTYEPGVPTGIKLIDGVAVQHFNFVDDGTAGRLWASDFASGLDEGLIVGGLTLTERRNIHEITDQAVPKYRAEMALSAGHEIPIEVPDRFVEMHDPDKRRESIDWLRGWYNSGEFWTELVDAWRGACSDDLGKQAVKSSIDKLVIRWEPGRGAAIELKDRVLTYFYNFVDCPRDGSSWLYAPDIREQLERQL